MVERGLHLPRCPVGVDPRSGQGLRLLLGLLFKEHGLPPILGRVAIPVATGWQWLGSGLLADVLCSFCSALFWFVIAPPDFFHHELWRLLRLRRVDRSPLPSLPFPPALPWHRQRRLKKFNAPAGGTARCARGNSEQPHLPVGPSSSLTVVKEPFCGRSVMSVRDQMSDFLDGNLDVHRGKAQAVWPPPYSATFCEIGRSTGRIRN